MAEKKKTSKRTRSKKSETSKVQVVVEVDGNPVGLLDLDWDRLWPTINHRNRDRVNIEWMKRAEFDAVANSTVLRRFMRRLEGRLYQGLGDEMVRAELDIENLYLKMDAAAQEFGRTDTELQQVLAGGGGTRMEFMNFLWDSVLGEREISDFEEEWVIYCSERKKKKQRGRPPPRERRQFSELPPARSYRTSTTARIPPRVLKSPTTFARTGEHALTISLRIRFTAFS